MSRPLRIEFSGAVYHITSRGNGKEDIFFDDSDRKLFLSIFWEVVKREKWICYAYCLMNNHYHLLIETPKPNLSEGMRQLNGNYAQKLNYKRKSVGHIFQDRFKSILVEKENYLLELCRYIVLNPVRAGLVEAPEEWEWSSYKAMIGLVKPPELLNISWILSNFDEDLEKAMERYKKFVLEGIGKESPWKELRGRIFLGSKNFIEKYEEKLLEKEKDVEIAKVERFANRPELEQIFRNIKTKEEKEGKIYQAYEEFRYNLKEIGNFLGIHYSTVSKIVKRQKNGIQKSRPDPNG
ncbi:MAG: transposase [candidate division WOR-3 bacterium]